MTTPSRSTQTLAVVLAFLAAVTSLAAALVGWTTRGELRVTPLIGGLLMLVLAISGVRRLRTPSGRS
jgi:hypothetical protein